MGGCEKKRRSDAACLGVSVELWRGGRIGRRVILSGGVVNGRVILSGGVVNGRVILSVSVGTDGIDASFSDIFVLCFPSVVLEGLICSDGLAAE